MRRILSLWLPRFATDRLRQRLARERAVAGRRANLAARAHYPPPYPSPSRGEGNYFLSPLPLREGDRGRGAHLRVDGEPAPLVTATALAGRAVIVAVDGRAAAAGLGPGLALADGRAILPGLSVHPADPAGDGAALDRLAEWATRYTPWTALDHDTADSPMGGAGLWLDITGCAHLFGGEQAMLGDLLARLARFGHTARAAIADGPGAAWAAARFIGDPGGHGVIVSPGGARALLAPLPVAALRLAPAMAAELERLGLRRVGDLLPLARAALARRFGFILAERLDQALGHGAEAISPRRPVAPHQARLALAEPILHADGIAAGLRRLLGQLCRQLDGDQQGARRIELTVYRVDGGVQRIAIALSRPNREPAALERLLAERIELIDPGFGIEAMALSAPRVEALGALQIVLREAQGITAPPTLTLPRKGGGDFFLIPPPLAGGGRGRGDITNLTVHTDAPDLAPLIDGLGNRLGFANLRRLAARASHIPERAVRNAPPLAAPAPAECWPALPPRPLHLFQPPQPIDAMALLPDHPPVLFRWRARLHRVALAEGPERFEPEWWRPEDDVAGARDYFRVEDQDGRRFWLYRDGAPPTAGRWYLHGLFG